MTHACFDPAKNWLNNNKKPQKPQRESSNPTDRLGFPCGSPGKNPPAMWETWVWSLAWEDALEKGKATHSSILTWRIPWTTVHGVAKSCARLSLSFSVVLKVCSLDQQHQYYLSNLVEVQILGPQLDLLNQKLWEWGQEICVPTNPPRDSDEMWEALQQECWAAVAACSIMLPTTAPFPRWHHQLRHSCHPGHSPLPFPAGLLFKAPGHFISLQNAFPPRSSALPTVLGHST